MRVHTHSYHLLSFATRKIACCTYRSVPFFLTIYYGDHFLLVQNPKLDSLKESIIFQGSETWARICWEILQLHMVSPGSGIYKKLLHSQVWCLSQMARTSEGWPGTSVSCVLPTWLAWASSEHNGLKEVEILIWW